MRCPPPWAALLAPPPRSRRAPPAVPTRPAAPLPPPGLAGAAEAALPLGRSKTPSSAGRFRRTVDGDGGAPYPRRVCTRSAPEALHGRDIAPPLRPAGSWPTAPRHGDNGPGAAKAPPAIRHATESRRSTCHRRAVDLPPVGGLPSGIGPHLNGRPPTDCRGGNRSSSTGCLPARRHRAPGRPVRPRRSTAGARSVPRSDPVVSR